MFAKIGLILLCATTKLSVLCAPTFTSWPQGVSSYRGGSAILKWTLSEAVSADWYSVVLIYNEATICTFKRNKLYYGTGYDESKVVADIKVGSADISLTLKDIQPEKVINHYTCKISITPSFSVSNTQGWLLMYDTPADPEISSSPPDIIENRVLTMICSARSTTALPSDVPNDQRPIINYTWQRDSRDLTNDGRHRVGGEANNTLTIDRVQKEDLQATYTCIAQQTGSKLRNSKDIQLDVKYRPGPATTNPVSRGPYFEAVLQAVTLSCTVNDQGSPPAMFEWSKDGIIKGENTTGSYIIASGQLSVSEHDGLWLCTPVNVAGRGQPATINLTVYAKPEFTNSIPNQTVRADRQSDLDVLCSVQSRPAADVIWQYEGGSLPVGVTVTSEADDFSGKLTIVKRHLTWSAQSTEEQRRSTDGVYICVGNVAGEERKHSVYDNVQYGPSNINTVPLDGVTKVENDSLTLTCAATFNPTCQYTWTKDSLLLISNSDKLQFASIRRQDQGKYMCSASNGLGNALEKVVSIQVDYPPKIAITVTPSGELVQGSEVTLVCIVDSSPSPTSITWNNITEAGLTNLDSSKHNDTHGWSTLSDIDLLDSGTYQCTADNGVRGSPVSASKVITVKGPARWFKTEPLDLVNGVSIGDTAYFKVWIIAQPLPTPNQWQWKFSPNNSSSTPNTESGPIALSVSGNLAVLSIYNVTVNDYGDYYIWTQNSYGGWSEGDLKFSLVPQGVPSKPDFFQATHVAAVSIKVQWTTGFNGGLSQTFTIRYTNLLSGVLFEKSAIEDTGLGSGQNITEYLTDGIEPKSKYQLQIFAVNAKGETAGDILTVFTPALAKFLQDPEIKIDGGQAHIHFIISGPLTHIEVENCAEETDRCLSENVTVPRETRRKRRTVEVLYDFISNVTLADPEARKFVFSFGFYDNEFQLASKEIRLNLDKLSNMLGATVGSLFGMAVVIIIIVILVVLSRKGLLKKTPGVIQDKRRNTSNSQGISHQMSELTENEEPQYEISRSTARQPSKEPSEYQSLLQPKLHIYTPASIKCISMLCHSDFYEIWKGWLSENRNSSLQIVIKTVKDYNEVHKQYLHSQGENLIKLRSKDSIVACLGMTSDHKHLILEDASLGNLKQYLQGKASETYYNVTDDNSSSNFIQQIIEGVEAVHELRPPVLFYCLCASNVLVFSGQKCKLTGFASVETVKAREKWEDENRFQRPFQWLSPEAINLNHVMQSDIWSLAILMWEIFSQGKLPFGDISSDESTQKILSGQKPVKPVKCSDDVYDLMTRCWMRQPSNRLSVEDLKLQYTELIQYESA